MKTFKNLLHAAALFSATFLTLSAATPAFAQRFDKDFSQPRTDSQFLYAFRDAIAEASKGTVRVYCDGKPTALGTVVTADGWILTKNSQLKDAKDVTCRTKDGKTLEAKIVGVQDKYDLAMLKVNATGLTPVKFAESKVASVGSWLATVGPSDDPVAVGVMSVAVRKSTNRDNPPPALDQNRGYLGITMKPVDGGVKIDTLSDRRSAASKAGLKPNDQILSVNGQPITDMESMQKIMSKTKPGDDVKLKIKRGDDEKEITARLGKAPQDRSDFQNNMGAEEGLSERRSGFPQFFQQDAVIKPKECGGPVCDLDGHVVGINIARAGRTETFAVPTEAILPLLPDLKSGKLAPKTETTKTPPDKKLGELKDALKKAEETKAAADKKFAEAKDDLKKLETDKAAADKKLKEAKDALDKAAKEKDKK